jgi:hypothetical protein
MMAALNENAVTLLSETTVDHSGAGQTTLYTVPTGKSCIICFVVIKAAGDEAATDITIGKTASWDDWMGGAGSHLNADMQLDNLDVAGDLVMIGPNMVANPATNCVTYTAGEVIKVDVVAANGNAGNTYYLYGMLF